MVTTSVNLPSAPGLPNHSHSLLRSLCIIIVGLPSQFLAHSRPLMSNCWMDGWRNEGRALCYIHSIPQLLAGG